MNIEQLNKAATAAGFAMATPEEDTQTEPQTSAEIPTAPSRALVFTEKRVLPTDMNGLAVWLKGVWPGFGWRLPA